MKKNRNLYRYIKLPIYIFIFTIIIWSTYWFLGTIYIENRVLKDNSLRYEKSTISGYPFHFDINLKQLKYNLFKQTTLKEINLKTFAWRFDQIRLLINDQISYQISNSIKIIALPSNLIIDFYNYNKNHKEFKIFGNDIVFSENYSNKSFSIDGISGTIKHEGIYNIDIVTNKGRSSLTAQGYVDTQNRIPTNHACYWRPVFDAVLAPNTTGTPRFVLCELAHPQKLTGKDISIQRVRPHR